MNEQNKKTEKSKARNEKDATREVGPRRPLLRSKDDRMLWGVAGGLATHLNIDPILVRLGFVVSLFFGGIGLLAYLVLAVAVPEDDGSGNPVDEGIGARLGRVLLVCLLVAAALAAAASLVAVSAWASATGHGTFVAAVVLALGVALAAAAFAGGSSRRYALWLVVPALLLAVPAGAVAAADIHFDGSVGQREYKPTTLADLPEDGYELGTGQLIVDLRELPFAEGQAVSLKSELGLGQMIVSVPSTVCVDAHVTAKGGELLVRGDRSDGVDPEVDQGEPTGSAPRLNLDAGLQFGQLIVTDQDPDEASDHRGPDYDQQFEDESQAEACGR
jgi:phage shock protein PspC (stress-responsive transcriptional regulator)